jgi:hypothetical protein
MRLDVRGELEMPDRKNMVSSGDSDSLTPDKSIPDALQAELRRMRRISERFSVVKMVKCGIGFNAQPPPSGMKTHCRKSEQKFTPWYARGNDKAASLSTQPAEQSMSAVITRKGDCDVFFNNGYAGMFSPVPNYQTNYAQMIADAINNHTTLLRQKRELADALKAILDDLEINEEQLPAIPAVCELYAQGRAALNAAVGEGEGQGEQ